MHGPPRAPFDRRSGQAKANEEIPGLPPCSAVSWVVKSGPIRKSRMCLGLLCYYRLNDARENITQSGGRRCTRKNEEEVTPRIAPEPELARTGDHHRHERIGEGLRAQGLRGPWLLLRR